MIFDDPLDVERPAVAIAGDADSLPDVLRLRARLTPDRVALREKIAGRWKDTTWKEMLAAAKAVATYLIDAGAAPGEKVTIVGRTCPAWVQCDLGGQLAGLVTVGAYPTLSDEQLAYIIRHSDSRVVFVDSEEDLAKVERILGDCPSVHRVVAWQLSPDDERTNESKLDAFVDVVNTRPDEAAIGRRLEGIDPDACAIIVYTSGTTGPPKGAMISHRNILSVLRASIGIDFDERDQSLSFLPLAHVAERVLGTYGRVNHGTATAYATSIPAVLEEIKEVRPTLFGSVPRIFEKAYARVQSEVAKASPARRHVFRWAESVALRAVDRWQKGERIGRRLRIQYALADRIVFRRLRSAFGGNIRFFVTGAAPIPSKVLRFFWGAGFPIFEAYGMTEGTVISHMNAPGSTRLGSVGKALPYVEHKLAEDGEILVRGPFVFLGYYKDSDATKKTIDDEGWLHTGDIGKIDDEGYLYIVDRKKHIIITAGGKNLTPANIENAIKVEDPMISHVHVHGDRRKFITALVTLSPVDAIEWAQRSGRLEGSRAAELRDALVTNPLSRPDGLDALIADVAGADEIRERILAAIKRGNAKLSRVEQVKRVALLDRELSLAEGEITPTMKVKRKAVEKRFGPTFDRLYDDRHYGLVVQAR